MGMTAAGEPLGILVTPERGPAPLQVQVAAVGLPPGTMAQWDFGDGTKGSGELLAHTCHSPGTYTLWLTAGGSACKATVTVTE
jgi:PKD repeat protein